MAKAKKTDPAFEKLFETWQKVATPLYNESYESIGPGKHEIEEMRTNLEYETRVVECVIFTWDGWEQDGKPEFCDLQQDQKERVVTSVLKNDDAKYGWYRGNLPELKAVRRALREL